MLNIGRSAHDPNDPIGRLLFNVLAMVAEFESDLARARTREGGGSGQGPGSAAWRTEAAAVSGGHLVALYQAGGHTTAELADLFSVARSTVYRAVARAGAVRTGGGGANVAARER